jgi:hypothetical protein
MIPMSDSTKNPGALTPDFGTWESISSSLQPVHSETAR